MAASLAIAYAATVLAGAHSATERRSLPFVDDAIVAPAFVPAQKVDHEEGSQGVVATTRDMLSCLASRTASR